MVWVELIVSSTQSQLQYECVRNDEGTLISEQWSLNLAATQQKCVLSGLKLLLIQISDKLKNNEK